MTDNEEGDWDDPVCVQAPCLITPALHVTHCHSVRASPSDTIQD